MRVPPEQIVQNPSEEVYGRYDASNHMACPVCGSGEIMADACEAVDASTVIRPIECDDCGSSWSEMLYVGGISNIHRGSEVTDDEWNSIRGDEDE